MDRRSFLKMVGIAGVGMGAGYVQFRRSGREGRVFWRQMAVDAGGDPGSLVVMREWLEDNGTVGRDLHPDYEEAFEGELRVPKQLHLTLQRRFGADEPYYLLRYESANCNGIPGDEGDNAVEVSRTEFNHSQVGDCVKHQ